MAARKTQAEKNEEVRKARCLAARRLRRANKKDEAALAEPSDAGAVNPVALGVAPAKVAAATPPKKVTEARANLSEAFELMGGVAELVRWGKKNPTEFYRIWARLIPKEVAEETSRLPLEKLLDKLADRAEMSVNEAAAAIGQEELDKAGRAVNMEDAIAAFSHSGTMQ